MHFVWGWVMIFADSFVVPLVRFLLLNLLFVHGQSTYGSIQDRSQIPPGPQSPMPKSRLTNMGTAEKRTQATGPDGLYSFVNLNPGQYRVDVEKSGFKHFARPGIAVEVQQSARIDCTLGSARSAKPSKSVLRHLCCKPILHRWERW